jgi:hypothetical protein
MKRRWIVLALVVLLAAVLTYLLRDFINDKVVVPLAYLWWRVGLYYHVVPENGWWATVVVIVFFMVLRSFNTEEPSHDRDLAESQPAQGPVEELTIWLMKKSNSAYYRWLVANHLAKLVRGFLIQSDGRDAGRWDILYSGSAWDPPEAVGAYLRSGLNRPTASFRSSSAPWGRSQMAPVDLDPEQAVAYLESQMENRSDGN